MEEEERLTWVMEMKTQDEKSYDKGAEEEEVKEVKEEETLARPNSGWKEHLEKLNEELKKMEKKRKERKENEERVKVKGRETPDETKTRIRVELIKTSKPREDNETK